MTVEDPAATGLAEALLQQRRQYTSRQVAALAGVPVYRARRYWRALGFANVPDDAVEFTDADVEALGIFLDLAKGDTFDEHHVLLLARALGRATARLAESEAELSAEALDQAGVPVDERAGTWLARVDQLLPDLERLLVYAWRRQLGAAAARLVEQEIGAARLAVGFADLVGFTRLSRGIDKNELAQLVERFESRSADIVTASGGRVVKTLGDSVLFVANAAHAAAEIGLRLIEDLAKGRNAPPIRVGIAIGPVIGLLGDVFGTTVNLASRLTALAPADSVLVDPAMADELAGDAAFAVQGISRIPVRGLGELTPFSVSRR